MEQLRLDGTQHPRTIEQPPIIKTPEDVYRVEVRVTFAPDEQLGHVAVEVTHEHSRELIYWKLGQLAHGEGELAAAIAEAAATAQRWVGELYAPF